MTTNCVTCGDPLMPERADIKNYCLKEACVRANYRPLKLVEIKQTKTNAEITILTPEVERAMAEGRYRRDPIVVGRQPSKSTEKVKLVPRSRQPDTASIDVKKARYVQALQGLGLNVDQVLERATSQAPYMRLTRAEIVRYMTGRRV